jgi:hypothetical protein
VGFLDAFETTEDRVLRERRRGVQTFDDFASSPLNDLREREEERRRREAEFRREQRIFGDLQTFDAAIQPRMELLEFDQAIQPRVQEMRRTETNRRQQNLQEFDEAMQPAIEGLQARFPGAHIPEPGIQGEPTSIGHSFFGPAGEVAGAIGGGIAAGAGLIGDQPLPLPIRGPRPGPFGATRDRSVTIGEATEAGITALDVPRKEISLPIARKVVPGDVPIELLSATTPALGGVSLAAGAARALGGPSLDVPEKVVEEALSIAGDPLNIIPGIGFGGKAAQGIRGGRKVAPGLARAAEEAVSAIAGAAPSKPLLGLQGKVREGFIPGGKPPTFVDNAARKLTALIKEAKPVRAETEALKSRELGRRAEQVREALVTGSGSERIAAARAQQTGKLPAATFEPPVGALTPEEQGALIDHAIDFEIFGAGQDFTRVRAGEIVENVLAGELPTQGEIAMIETIFGRDMASALLSKRTRGQKLWTFTKELAHVPTGLLTTLDDSFLGRQGLKVALRHPREWLRMAKTSAKIFRAGGEDFARQVDSTLLSDATPFTIQVGDQIQVMPFNRIKAKVGTRHDAFGIAAGAAERAEFTPSGLLFRIPGIKHAQIAFTVSGNKLRSDILKKVLQNAERDFLDGKKIPLSMDTVQGLSNFFNRATGRGTLGPFEKAGEALSFVQLAPRFRLAGPQAFLHMFHRDPVVRRAAAEALIPYFGTGLSLLGLIKMSGLADVEVDPRSSNFGKIRIGPQRIDFWGGLQQQARAIAMVATQGRKTQAGYIVPQNALDTALGYFRSGMQPVAGFLVDLGEGETIIGDELDPSPKSAGQQAFNRLMPLAWQDIVDAVRIDGLRGAIFSPMTLVGIGAQTFEERASTTLQRIPQFQGVPLEKQRQIKDFQRESREFLSEFQLNTGIDITLDEAVQLLGVKRGVDKDFVDLARELLKPSVRDRHRNLTYDLFILEHADELIEADPDIVDRDELQLAIGEARSRQGVR